MRSQLWLASSVIALASCAAPPPPTAPTAPGPSGPPSLAPTPVDAAAVGPASAPDEATANAGVTCGGTPLTIHFFDVGQGLSTLVKLPDGRTILIDAGESPTRPACGTSCKEWNQRLLTNLPAALGSSKLDALWITHQHSDHLGGVPTVLKGLTLGSYFDNGLDLTKAGIVAARKAATASGAKLVVESPGSATPPLSSTNEVKLTPVLPASWPDDCSSNPNECSIALRIDYCKSSMLFTGDAEEGLEGLIAPGDVNLLQVGHHASATSSSAAFLQKTKPEYAVISSGKPGEGTNGGFCHPREVTVTALTKAMGGAGSKTIKSFDNDDGKVKCAQGKPANWVETPASDNLWSTARDGDVVLVTKGDGKFERTTGGDSSGGSGSSGSAGGACCRTCKNSKPCGDACIPKANACSKPPGCACAAAP